MHCCSPPSLLYHLLGRGRRPRQPPAPLTVIKPAPACPAEAARGARAMSPIGSVAAQSSQGKPPGLPGPPAQAALRAAEPGHSCTHGIPGHTAFPPHPSPTPPIHPSTHPPIHRPHPISLPGASKSCVVTARAGARLVTRLLLLAAEQSQQRHTSHLDHLRGPGHAGSDSHRGCGVQSRPLRAWAPAPAPPRNLGSSASPHAITAMRIRLPTYLETDAGNITHGVASPTEPGDQDLVLQG